MDGNIYIVYDPSVEDLTSLNKFLGVVLDKAKFPLTSVQFKTQEEYLAILDTTLPNFTICLNKTYTEVSLKISNIVEQPPFKFFSRTYIDSTKKLSVLGLLNSVDQIFNDIDIKKSSWVKLLKFIETYNDYNKSGTKVVTTSKTEQDAIKKESVKEVVQPVEEKPIVTEISVTKIEQKDVKPSYEELLEFYTKAKDLISLVNALGGKVNV